MIRGFACEAGRLKVQQGVSELSETLVWIDLVKPTAEEERRLAGMLGIGIPSKEDMEEIEISSRLYKVDGAAFMTSILDAPANLDLWTIEIAGEKGRQAAVRC